MSIPDNRIELSKVPRRITAVLKQPKPHFASQIKKLDSFSCLSRTFKLGILEKALNWLVQFGIFIRKPQAEHLGEERLPCRHPLLAEPVDFFDNHIVPLFISRIENPYDALRQ